MKQHSDHQRRMVFASNLLVAPPVQLCKAATSHVEWQVEYEYNETHIETESLRAPLRIPGIGVNASWR